MAQNQRQTKLRKDASGPRKLSSDNRRSLAYEKRRPIPQLNYLPIHEFAIYEIIFHLIVAFNANNSPLGSGRKGPVQKGINAAAGAWPLAETPENCGVKRC